MSFGPSTLGSTMDEPTFGGRFLRKFKILGGSTKEWPSSAVDSLAGADRSAFRELVATGRTRSQRNSRQRQTCGNQRPLLSDSLTV